MRARIVLIVLVAAAIGVLLYTQTLRPLEKVSGFLEADLVRIGSRVGGRVAKRLVREGEPVTPGQVLVQLEPYDLKEKLAAAKARLASAVARRELLAKGFRPEEKTRAQADLEFAEAALQEAMKGPRPQEIKEAELARDLAQAELDLATSNQRRADQLLPTKSITREEHDRITSQRKAAAANLAVRETQLALLVAGTRVERKQQAKAKRDAADADHRLKQTGYRLEEIAEAAAQVTAAEGEVAALQVQFEELEIKSPLEGMVEAIELEPGDLISAGAPVISLTDSRRLWVRAYVPEDRLGHVAPGHELPVGVDTFPERRFRGRVAFVARQAEFTPSNVQTPDQRSRQVFRIKVELEEGLDVLRPGMAADVYLKSPASGKP